MPEVLRYLPCTSETALCKPVKAVYNIELKDDISIMVVPV